MPRMPPPLYGWPSARAEIAANRKGRADPIGQTWQWRDSEADSINAARSLAYRAKRKMLERYAGVM